MKEREKLKSRLGFILISAGCAIGIGNVWKFPYIAGKGGDGAILTATQNGYGKRTAVAEYPTKSRATKGVISIKVTERNGLVVGAVQVDDCDQIMMITDAGTLVRTRVSEISIVGRNTQGVILIRTSEDENVVGLQRVAEPVDEEDLDTIDGSAAEGDDEIAPEVDVDDEPEEE